MGADEELIETVLVSMERGLPEHAERVVDRLQRLVPELDEHADPSLIAALRHATEADMRVAFALFRLDQRLPREASVETAQFARLVARTRLSLSILMRVYRLAAAVWAEMLFGAVRSAGASSDQRDDVLQLATGYMLSYMDQVSLLVTEEFNRERDRTSRRRELRRSQAVRDLLAGRPVRPTDLDYPINGTHLGLVISGPDSRHADRLLADAQTPLLIITDDDSVWLWASAPAPRLRDLPQVLAHRALDCDLSAGIGRITDGLEGFRFTHHQALAANKLAAACGERVTRYEDVALELLCAHYRVSPIDFVNEELGALATDTTRARRLRQTLRAYLTSGQNGAACAASVGISPRTVSHRLRACEETLGVQIADRSAELHTALRLHHLFERGAL